MSNYCFICAAEIPEGKYVCEKCENSVKFSIDGEHKMDRHLYRDIQVVKNVTVVVSQCVDCGHIEISWHKQDDTEDITNETVCP